MGTGDGRGRLLRLVARGTAVALVALLLSVLGPPPTPLAAQAFCFRGQPLPACSGFLLFDFHAHYAVAENGRERVDSYLVLGPDGNLVPGGSVRPLDGFTWAVGADVGYARNVAPAWAVGGTVGVEGVEGGPRFVLNGRARRWLGAGMALDLMPGVFLLKDAQRRSGDEWVVGGLVGARLDLASLGFLSLRYEAMELEPDVFELGDTKRVDPGGFQHALSAGAGLGSQAGIVAFVAAGVIVLAVFAALVPG